MKPEAPLPLSQSPPHVPILSQINPIYTALSHVLNIHFIITLSSTPRPPKWSLSRRSPHQTPVRTSSLVHTCYMPRPSHSSRFHRPNNTVRSTVHKAPRYVVFSTLSSQNTPSHFELPTAPLSACKHTTNTNGWSQFHFKMTPKLTAVLCPECLFLHQILR